jgi:hypothetical protein
MRAWVREPADINTLEARNHTIQCCHDQPKIPTM